MSVIADESSKDWLAFKNKERTKFPHFMKTWFDNNGEISGDHSLKRYKWEVNQYLKDRDQFLSSLASTFQNIQTQVEKPSPASAHTGESVKLIPGKKRVNPPPSGKKKAIPSSSAHNTHQNNKNNIASTMPKPTKRSRAWKRSGRKRRSGNKALTSVKVPFKMVMEVNTAKSSTETGHWHNHLTIAELAGSVLKSHEEFKCCSMKVRFIPEDITTGSGLYAACLLDQNGFGDPVQATTVWFPRVADLPGARLCHVTRGCVFTWHPTEPDSRNYRKSDTESNTVVASFYIFGNSASLSIKGQLLITGLLRARGEFYSASIASRIRELSLYNAPEDSARDDIESLDD